MMIRNRRHLTVHDVLSFRSWGVVLWEGLLVLVCVVLSGYESVGISLGDNCLQNIWPDMSELYLLSRLRRGSHRL